MYKYVQIRVYTYLKLDVKVPLAPECILQQVLHTNFLAGYFIPIICACALLFPYHICTRVSLKQLASYGAVSVCKFVDSLLLL